MTTTVEELAVEVLFSPPSSTEVEELAVEVLFRPPAVLEVEELAVEVLHTDREFRQPGFYVKADDGDWHVLAQFPWLSS